MIIPTEGLRHRRIRPRQRHLVTNSQQSGCQGRRQHQVHIGGGIDTAYLPMTGANLADGDLPVMRAPRDLVAAKIGLHPLVRQVVGQAYGAEGRETVQNPSEELVLDLGPRDGNVCVLAGSLAATGDGLWRHGGDEAVAGHGCLEGIVDEDELVDCLERGARGERQLVLAAAAFGLHGLNVHPSIEKLMDG